MRLPIKCESLTSSTLRSDGEYSLWLSTQNTSVGTHVSVTCSKVGLSNNGSVSLTCARNGRWNGTLTDCFLNAHEKHHHANAPSNDFTTEVVIIWSVGGAMIAMLAVILVAVLFAKYRPRSGRRIPRSATAPSNDHDSGLQNPGFVTVFDIDGSHVTGRSGNMATVIPATAPPYPGSPRAQHNQLPTVHGRTPTPAHFALPPPPYPGSLRRDTNHPNMPSTTIVTSSIVHAPPGQSTPGDSSHDRHNRPMPLPLAVQPTTASQETIEPPPPYTRYPNQGQGQRQQGRRSFSARVNRSMDSTIYI